MARGLKVLQFFPRPVTASASRAMFRLVYQLLARIRKIGLRASTILQARLKGRCRISGMPACNQPLEQGRERGDAKGLYRRR
jgi:hypothetical protein